MNGLVKAAFRFTPSLRSLASSIKVNVGKREFTRTLWHMCKSPENSCNTTVASLKLQNPSVACTCGCQSKYVHTKGERELVEFLTEEIIAEKKTLKAKTVPTELEGFKVKLDGAEVELSKQTDKEKIIISFNINHTVDADDEAELEPTADKPNFAEMKSRPQFEVDIVKGNTTLSFTCSFLRGPPQEGEYSKFESVLEKSITTNVSLNEDDIYGIEEVTIFQGEWNEKVYAVAGDVLDGYLYDLLMNFLEEKGISSEFVEKLSELSTAYEHSSYIALLEGLSKFTTGK